MFLGVDLGTSSIKLLLANEKGEIVASSVASYDVSYPKENYSEQNPEDWWTGFLSATNELGEKYDLTKVKTIAFSGQMHGLVILDENDEVIRPAILWNDGRTVKECDYLNNEIGKDKLIEWTGNIAITGFTAPKILWVRENEPENFRKIRKIMLPKDYLQYKLSGVFASDVSDNSGTLYFDVRNKCWSNKMLDILSIDEKMLPKTFESFEIVGSVKKELAIKLGFSENTKLVIGGGDQAMGAIGTGTITSGQISISLGTSGVIFINADEFVLDKKASLHSFCHANGKYHLMGVTLSCAASSKWWVEEVLSSKNYDEVLGGISATEIDDLVFLPYLIGERSPINDPLSKGALYGLKITHTQKDITKAIIEGICFSLKDCLKVANEGGVFPKFARVIGGGAKSSEWLQILSDVLNLEIRTINTNEGGGLGAIILGMYASKEFASIEEACKALIKETSVYLPRSDKAKRYEAKFQDYKKLYESVKTL